MSIVYVIQETRGKNILPAKKFGTLVPLLDGNQHVGLFFDHITKDLQAKLVTFSDDDYLLLIGDPVVIGLATAIACKNNHGRANLLKWDRECSEYYDVKIDLAERG